MWALWLIGTGCDGSTPAMDDTDVEPVSEVVAVAPYERPPDRLAATGATPCGTMDATRCEAGREERCSLVDVATGAPVEDADPLLRRVYLYDRWFDGYHSPDGQAVERDFRADVPAGTPEETWADPELLRGFDGYGDSAIWTGVAVHSALLRWLTTGTSADEARFLEQLDASLLQFEVTGYAGHLARAHVLVAPDGTPQVEDHILVGPGFVDDIGNLPAADVDGLPDVASLTIPDGEGGVAEVSRWWRGNPSIDQYTGPMVVYPAAWSLVDAPRQARIERAMTCYLNRLERIEVRNLQQRPELAEAVAGLLGGAAADASALDLDDLDTLVAFVLPGIYQGGPERDRECPAFDPTTPDRILDAASPTFTVDLLALGLDMSTVGRPTSIDHFYAPGLRGGDAVHLMHLAAMAHLMTGDAAYADFLRDELVGTLRTDEVAATMGLLVPPPWCRAFYGDHITIPPAWALHRLLAPGTLRDAVHGALLGDGWEKLARGLDNAKFHLMLAEIQPEGAPLRAEMIAAARQALEALHGNGGVEDDPRRTYLLDPDDVRAWPGFAPRCPTVEERAFCEADITLLGITVPGEPISAPCTGAAGECVLADGLCARELSAVALPPDLRKSQDFLWQRSPFDVGEVPGGVGRTQRPGLDLTESYWLARAEGLIDGPDHVLAWVDEGACPP